MAADHYNAVVAVFVGSEDQIDVDENDEEVLDIFNNDIFVINSVCAALLSREDRRRIIGYVNKVVPDYREEEFRRMFRVGRQTFDILCGYFTNSPHFPQKEGFGGREPVAIKTQLLVTLWYLGGQETIIKIADRFGMSESTVIMCRKKVVNFILEHLMSKFITWPVGQQAQETVDKFSQRNGFPGILGSLDGTHIKIKAPKHRPQAYVNRKNFHSLQLQAVCNTEMVFISCFAGFPGKTHDARVLACSDLWDTGPELCQNYHIIADAAYPLQTWLLTPYRDNGHLTPEQRNYNFKHSANRVIIERAFSLLKGRFRRLQNLETCLVLTACEIIMACCVLHNICLLEHDSIEEFLDRNDDENHDGQPLPALAYVNNQALLKRNNIARNL
ncbi:putative nuclease HARBI1 [Ylistrum balloti]|uniref:putative nuclease HARBI1 n=1 Tax=Ylistrum balloti TaxID=509963 RepID=UPI0029058027|nr:putative nuclease HARBI1 [Ylistrum balloti]